LIFPLIIVLDSREDGELRRGKTIFGFQAVSAGAI
jgi:hypothetical protein